MEGVTDAPMRALMSERGGFSLCVSEFLRISHEVPPARIFRQHVPELASGGRTASGIPVSLQLLGGDPGRLAEAAALAARLGAGGIDLNFGCPAPTVNRHDGGATLLKYPSRIRAIVAAVRAAVPPELPVSAKLRLGWDTLDAVHENAERAAEGGASWVTIHGRTRAAGYAPPAYWGPIGEVCRRLAPLPIVANGDIFTREDFRRCREETGAVHFMLGRGALGDPTLPLHAAAELGIEGHRAPPLAVGSEAREWLPILRRFDVLTGPRPQRSEYLVRRMKQWVRMAGLRRPIPWFDELKRAQSLDALYSVVETAGTSPSA